MIPRYSGLFDSFDVALLAESVDRNNNSIKLIIKGSQSLSLRRAWIEIYIIKITEITPTAGRSPCGERG